MFFSFRVSGGKREKSPAVALTWQLEHTSTLEADRLQPFYLQPGSGRTVLKEIARCENYKMFILYIFFGPSAGHFVSVADLKYLPDRVLC